MTWAAGTVGSLAAGLLECWVDGTQTKFLHSGFAAQNGIHAAMLAQAGATGPPRVLEGRFGLFASHLQDASLTRAFGRVVDELGTRWESRNASFKPFPAARAASLHRPDPAAARPARHPAGRRAVDRLPVAEFNVSIVCEPVEEKVAPATEAHGRVCLQFTLAEALVRGQLGRSAYSEDARHDPEILAVARRVTARGPGLSSARTVQGARADRAQGRARVRRSGGSTAGRSRTRWRWTSCAPSPDNASGALPADQRTRLVDAVARTEVRQTPECSWTWQLACRRLTAPWRGNGSRCRDSGGSPCRSFWRRDHGAAGPAGLTPHAWFTSPCSSRDGRSSLSRWRRRRWA